MTPAPVYCKLGTLGREMFGSLKASKGHDKHMAVVTESQGFPFTIPGFCIFI